jgi:hypothetical protein
VVPGTFSLFEVACPTATPCVAVGWNASGVGVVVAIPAVPLGITTTSLPGATLGTSYSATLAAIGGVAPYSWSIQQGSVPAGLSLNSATGVISGTPAMVGASSFTVQVTDAESPPALGTAQLSITVGSTATVAGEGLDGALWVQTPQLSSGWQFLGGQIIAAPAVAAVPQSSGLASPLFIGTGVDHALWIRSVSQGWTLLAPSGSACLDNPAAVVTGTASAPMLTVACQGFGDHALYAATVPVPSSGLPSVSGWAYLGGGLNAGPAVAPVNGVITYFVTAPGNQVWTRTFDTNWAPVNLLCVGHPATGIAQGGTTTWFGCLGVDGQLWAGPWSGGIAPQGLAIAPGPGLGITSGANVMFAEGNFGSRSVWFRTTTADWADLGGSVVNGVGAVGLG